MDRPSIEREARDWARRICRQYDLKPPFSIEDLLRILRDRGCGLIRTTRFRSEGAYFRLPEPVVVFSRWAGPFVLAHELMHHLWAELLEWDDGDQYVYAFHSGENPPLEALCDAFAELVTGETRD